MGKHPRPSIIANLYWFWRNCRNWETEKRRNLLYQIHKEKVYLFTQGFSQAEIKEICRILRHRQCHLVRTPTMLKLEDFNQRRFQTLLAHTPVASSYPLPGYAVPAQAPEALPGRLLPANPAAPGFGTV